MEQWVTQGKPEHSNLPSFQYSRLNYEINRRQPEESEVSNIIQRRNGREHGIFHRPGLLGQELD